VFSADKGLERGLHEALISLPATKRITQKTNEKNKGTRERKDS